MLDTIRIEKIIAGGAGLGRRADGKVILVPRTLPDETVRVRETRKFRGHSEGELVDILERSPDRVEPPCPMYGLCGGCDFQHIRAEAQIRIKGEIVTEALSRAGLAPEPGVRQPAVAAPQPFGYRSRIRLKLSEAGGIGFYRSASNDLVELRSCPVAADPLNELLNRLLATGIARRLKGDISEIELQHSPADDGLFLLLHPRRNKKPDPAALGSHCMSRSELPPIYLAGGDRLALISGPSGQKTLRQAVAYNRRHDTCVLRWSPNCFSQVNAAQNQRLINHVLEAAAPLPGKQVLDLYCGMGNFSVPLACRGALVTGIELNPEAIAWARRNAEQAGPGPHHFRAGDVQTMLSNGTMSPEPPDIILLDPPRRGVGHPITRLADLGADKIIYVSCDPATLARDLALLVRNGYTLKNVTPFDMFPQTHHIETVALLEKN